MVAWKAWRALGRSMAVMDSFFPDHPGLPQDSATFRHNLIYAYNRDY